MATPLCWLHTEANRDDVIAACERMGLAWTEDPDVFTRHLESLTIQERISTCCDMLPKDDERSVFGKCVILPDPWRDR